MRTTDEDNTTEKQGHYTSTSQPSGGIFMHQKNIVRELSPADSFTILNSIAGLLSIFMALEGERYFAFGFVLLAVLADGLDGVVAQTRGGHLGRYIDEFADIVSFCVTPCIFIYTAYDLTINLMFFAVSSLFLIAGILHLINYHLGSKGFFIGITTPAAAIIIVCIGYVELPFWIVVVTIFFMAILMIAPLTYPRIENLFAALALVVLVTAMTGKELFVWMLLFLTILYAILGPVYLMIRWKNALYHT